ncbi:MAG: ISKra4 family transposase, partial [Candidatus Tectomicrobia bacterium]|nr:ISKra4 family transposase [Candidatus Tectomicrobia bacterium]
LGDLDRRIDHFTATYPRFPRLKRAVRKFGTYIENNRAFIPNYGKRYRNGETISTAFVESTVNSVLSKHFVKRQSLQWTKRGAHLLLQTRVKTLNQA